MLRTVAVVVGAVFLVACSGPAPDESEPTADTSQGTTSPGEDAAEVAAPEPGYAGTQGASWTGIDLVDGQEVSFPDVLDGKPAVLVFWATWCPYCKAFMPYAGDIQRDYAEHGVRIVTFNAKERGVGDPEAYAKSLGFPLVAVAEADGIAEDYSVEFIPGLMVVDGSGFITYRRGWTDLPAGAKVAEQWDGEVRQALDALL